MANPFYRYLKNVALTLLMTGTALAVTTGCDSVIYDDEGDCELHYRLKFRFDYNLLFADAFPHRSVRWLSTPLILTALLPGSVRRVALSLPPKATP